MLETIRDYALEKLEASGEMALTKRAHAAYCLVLAEGAEWLERFAIEHHNFRAALEWLTEIGDAQWGLGLGTAWFKFWEVREYLAEGRESLSRLLKLAGVAAPCKVRMRALFAAGVLAGEQGDYASGESLIREGQSIARQLGDNNGGRHLTERAGSSCSRPWQHRSQTPYLKRALRCGEFWAT